MTPAEAQPAVPDATAAPPPETITAAVLALADADGLGLVAGNVRLSHAEVVGRAAARAAWLRATRQDGPFHVAVMLENVPEFVFWLEAAALAGAVVVGANPTHRGDELVRDLAHTECQFLITDSTFLPLVEGARIGDTLGEVARHNERVLVLDTKDAEDALGPYVGADPAEVVDRSVTAETLGYLLFTSGTSGAPKACLCSQGRLARIGAIVAQMYALEPADVCYLSMPLFHSNALMAGWGPALIAGSAFALPATGRFSASGFLPDVRAAGATYFNYVGKPLSYIVATPEQPDDADNPLVRAFGNEGTPEDVARFAERFAVTVTDAYGSTEGGATVQRTPDTPPGAWGGPRREQSCWTRRRAPSAPRPASTATEGCSTPRRRSASSCPRRGAPDSRGTGATVRPRRHGCGRAGTGRATSPTATTPASSTSPAGTTTGSASTARTSHRPRSSGSCSDTPMWCWRRSMPYRTPSWATR